MTPRTHNVDAAESQGTDAGTAQIQDAVCASSPAALVYCLESSHSQRVRVRVES